MTHHTFQRNARQRRTRAWLLAVLLHVLLLLLLVYGSDLQDLLFRWANGLFTGHAGQPTP